MFGGETQTGTLRLLIDGQRKKNHWWTEIWSCRGKEKGRLQESVRKWNWPSVLDPHSTIKACCLNLSLSFSFFFWEERFALPHKSLSKHTNTHPQIICHHHHHHLSAGWRTVGARNIVTVWTNSPNISDVRHRYENTHIKARVCVCVCVCVTPPVASTLTSQLDPPPPPPPHLALTKYTCWASSSAVL